MSCFNSKRENTMRGYLINNIINKIFNILFEQCSHKTRIRII